MSKNVQIAVPHPCHEKWSLFTKTSRGGFCASCQKEVIDFTSWSDVRIKFYFKNLKGSTCGRFRQDQLKVYSYDRGNPRITWLSVLFAGFIALFSSRNVSAQTTPKQATEHYQSEKEKKPIQREKPATVTIIGTVTSREDGQAIEGVKVVLRGGPSETVTDAAGKFSLDLPNKDASQFIVFSFRGFMTVEYLHNVTRPGREIAIDMKRDNLINIENMLVGTVGGVVVSRRFEPREIAKDVWWWLTGR